MFTVASVYNTVCYSIIEFWHWYGTSLSSLSTCSALGLVEAQHKHVHKILGKILVHMQSVPLIPVTVANGGLSHQSYKLLLWFSEDASSTITKTK